LAFLGIGKIEKTPKPKRVQPFGLDSFTRTLYENEKNYEANYKVNIYLLLGPI
jgi:hypothetical protein